MTGIFSRYKTVIFIVLALIAIAVAAGIVLLTHNSQKSYTRGVFVMSTAPEAMGRQGLHG